MKMKMRNIIAFLLWAMLFNIPVFSQRINNIIIFSIELMLTICFLCQQKVTKQLIKLCIPIILLWITFIITTFINVGFETRTLNAFITGYKYVLFFYGIGYFVNINKYENIIGQLYKLSLALLFFSDMVVIISKGKGIGGDEVLGNFFIGNKFAVSYLHMLFLCFFQTCRKKKKRFKFAHYLTLAIYSMIICYVME